MELFQFHIEIRIVYVFCSVSFGSDGIQRQSNVDNPPKYHNKHRNGDGEREKFMKLNYSEHLIV